MAEARDDALAAIGRTMHGDELAAALETGRRLRLDEVLTEVRSLAPCNKLVTRVGKPLA